MHEPFIRNHHYNSIKNEADSVLRALRTVGDPKILESVRYGARAKVAELFPDVGDELSAMLESVADLKTGEELQRYMQALEPYLIAFPPITESQIRKLFPKVKKLKVPDLGQIDFRFVTYLSWIDPATNKMFVVYPAADGRFVGIEGRYTDSVKKGYCFVCNRFENLVMFSAIAKKKPANASPDYYKSVGNYLCASGHDCNKNVTDTASLTRFIDTVVG